MAIEDDLQQIAILRFLERGADRGPLDSVICRGVDPECFLYDEGGSSPASGMTLNGETFTVSDAFTGAHGTGTHYHADDGLTAPSVATDLAEVGGFFGDEECRGLSEIALSAIDGSITTATIDFQVADLFAEGLSGTPGDVGGMYGQSASTETIAVEIYTADGVEDLASYSVAIIGTAGSFDATGAAVDDPYSFDVKTLLQTLITASATHMGVRLRQTTGDANSGATTFDRFKLLVNGG